MTAKTFFTHPLGIVVSAAGATFLWGSAFPVIKSSYVELGIGADDLFQQMLFAGYRFSLAALLIFGLMTALRKPVAYRGGTWRGIGKIALFQTFMQYICFYIGISMSSGIQGSIIAGTTSFFQIAIAHFMYKNDAMSMRKGWGLVLGFAGVVIVNIGRGEIIPHFGVGEWLLIASMFFGAMGNVLSKQESQRMELMYMTSYQMLLGGVGLMLVGMSQVGFMPFAFSLKSGVMLIYLALLSAIGFILWNSVMKYNKVGKVSMYLFLIPVSGVLLSALILDEALSLSVLIALALVGAGIVIVNRDGGEKRGKHGAAPADKPNSAG